MSFLERWLGRQKREDYLPGVEGSKKHGELPKTEEEQAELAEKMGIESLPAAKKRVEEALRDVKETSEEAGWENAEWEANIKAAKNKPEETK